MSFLVATEALLAALRAAGTAGAAWGDRVYATTASEVVELAGPGAGDPVVQRWPFLELVGPALEEHKALRAPHQDERYALDPIAGTQQVRRRPRVYHLTFTVRFQTRVGATAAGETASQQLLRAVMAFEAWVAATPKVAGYNLIAVDPLSPGRARRVTPADVREATGAISLRDVPNYHGGLTTVAVATDLVASAGVDPDR